MIPGIVAGGALGSGPVAGTTWDPSNKSSEATLTNANMRLTRSSGSGNYGNTRSVGAISGKRYFSVALNWGASASGRVGGVGVADATWDVASTGTYIGAGNSVSLWGPGDGGNNWRVYVNGSTAVNGSTPIGTSIQIAVDAGTRKVWIRESGGAWIGGGDPAAGTSPTVTVPGSGDLYAAATSYATAGWATRYFDLQSAPGDVTGTAPSGFVRGIY